MKEKILTRNFCFAFLSLFFCSMVMYMLMTTITEYATAFGATATVAGLVSGIYVIGGLCSRLYAGGGLERVGWKKLALIFLAIHMLACCCYFFASNIVLLIVIRFIHGIGFGASASAIMTIGMSILPKSRYGEAAGYFMLAPTLAIAAGPFAGGLVYDNFGPNGCFIMSIILSLCMFLFIALVDIRGIDPCGKNQKEKSAEPARGLNRLLEVKAIPISICMFMFAFGYVAVMSFYRLYAVETNLTAQFSYFFLMYAVVLLFSRPIAGKLQDKYGDNCICFPGILAQAIGLFCIAWYPCMVTIVICAIGCALGYGTLNSCCNAIACKHATTERRSYAVSTFWVFCDGGMGIGPTILGAIVTAAGSYTPMYFTAAAITILAVPVYYLAWGRSGGKCRKSERV